MKVFLKALVGDCIIYRDGNVGRICNTVTSGPSSGYLVTEDLGMNTFYHHILGGRFKPDSPVNHKDILILR